MLTILIFLGLGFSISFFRLLKNGGAIIEAIFVSVLVAAASSILGVIVALLIPSVTETDIQKISLMNLNDGSSMHGSFFLGSGTIDEKMQYTYYYEDNGYYKLGQVECSKALIKYNEGDPFLEIHRKKLIKGPVINYFSLVKNTPIKIVFNIPEGSIKSNFHLDAK